jgi:hypothetical protein
VDQSIARDLLNDNRDRASGSDGPLGGTLPAKLQASIQARLDQPAPTARDRAHHRGARVFVLARAELQRRAAPGTG